MWLLRRYFWRLMGNPANFEDALRIFISKKRLQSIKQKIEHQCLLTRVVAAELALHENTLVQKIANYSGWRYLPVLPNFDMEVHEIDWQFCIKKACLPIKVVEQYVGIAACNPDLLPASCLEMYEGRIYLISVGQFHAALEQVKRQLADVESESDLGHESEPESYKLVYLLDDREDFLNAASSVIQELGMRFKAYTSAALLLGDLQKSEILPDLIISDINMPDGSGFDLARQLQARQYPLSRLLLASSDGTLATELLVLKLGVAGFMLKHKGPEYFALSIQQFFNNKNASKSPSNQFEAFAMAS